MTTIQYAYRKLLFGGAIGVALIFAASAVRADDAPHLKAGLWEFNRSVDAGTGAPQSIKASKCTDPTQLFNTHAQIPGCKVSAPTRSGNSYTFTAECTVQGTPMTSTTVVAVENDSAYTQTVESRSAAQKTKEVLVAKRIGDCKAIGN